MKPPVLRELLFNNDIRVQNEIIYRNLLLYL